MEQETQKVIEKIQKLYRLSQSSNEYEAALAIQKAQSLIEEYNLSQYDIQEKEFKVEAEEKELYTYKRQPAWKTVLLGRMQSIFNASLIRIKQGKNQRIIAIGLTSDIELLNFTFIFLCEKISEFSKKSCSENKNDYCLGLVLRIAERLKEAKEAKKSSIGTELVLAKDKIIEDFFNKKYPSVEKERKRIKTKSHDSFFSGYCDGDNIEINTPIKKDFQNILD